MVPLYNKSNYTLLSSLLKIEDIIEFAKENNLSSIALTDTNMFGTMEFIKKCQKESLNPVIGLDILLKDYNVVVYAKDYTGYQSLIKLSTIQNERIITEEDLKEYNKNLIAILPFKNKEHLETIKAIYVDYYLGYQNKQEEKEARILTPNIVYFQEALYKTSAEEEFLKYLYYIRDGKTITDEVDYDTINHELQVKDIHTKSKEEGLENTELIARQCHLEFPKERNLLPRYDCENPDQYLLELCKVGLQKRLKNQVPKKYQDRLILEWTTIKEMGFSNYFLVVYDFIKYAKKHDILVGPGRGSAAGSLVAYTLGITEIDPMEYNLLFERFLNPERKTMPDIDTDFPDNKREEVIQYVKEKYGEKRVSGIITFGTMASKQVIRDVSRVLNIPIFKVDSLCKFISNTSKDKLIDIYQKNEAFRTRVESDTNLSNMMKIAIKIEGFPRHTSSHAAGIVMSQVDLDEVLPLYKTDNIYLTSYSMEYLEELGLLKMDFLSIKNLTMIDNMIHDINKIFDKKIEFSKIPLNDKETLKIFETANTCGIFQFESTGMKNFLRKLKPTTFEDIFAAIALFRPGAAVNIDSFIRRKNKEEKIEYLDESLKDITENTYGILIYQEQIMQVANIYANYSLGEADILRRAMSKKKLDLLKAEEEKFIRKSMENNHPYNQAKKIFDLILNFAGYGFNKSHSVVYSMIAYKMAYLKRYYPTVFFSNLLTNVIGSEEKTNEYILEAKSNQIEVIKPTIQESSSIYTVKDNQIIFPITNIKGIGIVVSEQIEKAKEKGPFEDIYDCISRLYIAGIGKKTMETLIIADVFKGFNLNRATLIYNLDSFMNYAELTKDIDPSLVMKPEIEFQKEWDKSILLEKEKEVFGFYLSSHPTTMYKKENPYTISIKDISEYQNKKIDTLILIEKIKIIETKKGDNMAFVTGSDETGNCEYTIFPKLWKQYNQLEKGNLLKVRGTVEKRLNNIQIIVEKIKPLQGEEHE